MAAIKEMPWPTDGATPYQESQIKIFWALMFYKTDHRKESRSYKSGNAKV